MADSMNPSERMKRGLQVIGAVPLEEGEKAPRRLCSTLQPLNDEAGEYMGIGITAFWEDRADQRVGIFVPALSSPEEPEATGIAHPAGRIPPQEEIATVARGLSVPLDYWRSQQV